MICLGIETTAHTFGIGIIDEKGRVVVNEKSVYVPKKGKGILPREAASHHIENSTEVLKNALKKTNRKNIDLIAVAAGPGLPPCLHVGLKLARFLALKLKKPLVCVNHCIAHIEIGKLKTKCKDPIVVYLSGGNTQIIGYADGRYRIFGETEDVPIGNALDTLARSLDLKIPGGPEIERCTKGGNYIELPYVVKGMDLSFTGLVTDALKKYKSGSNVEDLCYSFQETSFAMLTEVTERALAHIDKNEVLLVGGVAVNKRLQEMMSSMCGERSAKLYVVPNEYAGDNGINIAWAGILDYSHNKRNDISDSKIRQKRRTDEVSINWLD